MFMLNVAFKLHYWPIITSCWCIVSILITYAISISDKHVYPLFPFISDTGARPPESCIFSFMFNIEAVLLAITLYIRHEQVKLAIEAHKDTVLVPWNKWSIPFGLIGSLGISIVGNFQEIHVMGAHSLGAFMAFGIGLVYFIIQAKISYAFRKYNRSIHYLNAPIVYLRIFLIGVSVPLFFTASICSTIAWEQYTGEHIEYWTKEDGAFVVRLFGTFTEWIAAIFMMIFILTFTKDFQTLKFKEIRFEPLS